MSIHSIDSRVLPVIKIACYGFSFYKIAKIVNLGPQFQMDVYLQRRDFESFKSEIGKYEDWVHCIEFDVKERKYLTRGRLWEKLGVSADLYLLSDDSPLFAYPSRGSKVIFMPIGFDLTVLPFVRRSKMRSSSFKGKLKRLIVSLIQKFRIRQVDEIWASPFPIFVNSLKLIRKDIELERFLPFPINFEAHVDPYSNREEIGLTTIPKNRFQVFFPGRLMVTKSELDLLTGQTKGAEKAILAFAEFVKTTNQHSILILIDNPHSPDSKIVKSLISDLEISDNVLWLSNSVLTGRFTSFEMAGVYRNSDVILGDFGAGWFGQTIIEAGAHRKPVISNIDDALMTKFFGNNPFLQANSEKEIFFQLESLHNSTALRTRKADEIGLWFEEYFSHNAVKRWFEEEITAFFKKKDV